MPETRRFAQGLKRKSTIGDSRDVTSRTSISISPATFVTESTATVPVAYEQFIEENSSKISKDQLKSLLLFPEDDFQVIEQSSDRRTEIETVPIDAEQQASSLMVKQCITACKRNWNVVVNKFEAYAGDYKSLPKIKTNNQLNLDPQTFEIDEEPGNYESDVLPIHGKQAISHKGWLYKSTTYVVPGSAVRNFKRRFSHLNEFSDHSQILNFYKDDKTMKNPKGAIYLESCVGVTMNSKARKHGFEIRMADNTCYYLAADSDAEAHKWVKIINLALQRNMEAQARDKAAATEMLNRSGNGDTPAKEDTSAQKKMSKTMHPELMKYAQETDHKNTEARKRNRTNVFQLFPDFHDRNSKHNEEEKVRPPTPITEVNNPRIKRMMVTCKSINFSIRGVVQDGCEEPITNVEPFFVTLSLYDAMEGRKISADLHVDLNHQIVRKMIPEKISFPSALNPGNKLNEEGENKNTKLGEPQLSNQIDLQWIAHPKQGIFTISKPHSEIYLVARIEKVLQGGIKSCAQPYLRYDSDNTKTAMKVLKHVKPACQRLGHYRMPFAWSARPLFGNEQDHHQSSPSFGFVYKQEANKISDEDLLKYLQDFKKLEKNTKLEYIDCSLSVGIDCVPTDLPNILTSSLVPVKPYAHKNRGKSPSSLISPDAIFEVDEFTSDIASLQQVNMEYVNHCYIYPKSLDYDGQKTFAKARNLIVVAEFRDKDENVFTTPGLRSFYKRPGPPGKGPFSSRVSTSVLHHHDHPQFYEEWKLELPTQLHHGHHILFSFYHIMVDINAKKKDTTYLEVGYAWLPLLTKDGHVTHGQRHLPISVNLPPRYLFTDEQQLGGKHSSDVRWVDGGKELFHVDISVVSSIYTSQVHLHNFFNTCERFKSGKITDVDLTRNVKGLLAVKDTAMVRFLPIIIDQLLHLMTAEKFSTEAQNKCMHALIHVVSICSKSEHDQLLKQYIRYMFVTAKWKDYESKTIHEELVTSMTATLRSTTNDFLTANQLLRHSNFFFGVVIKSIAQHLKQTGKINQSRSKRFPISFSHVVLKLVEVFTSEITKKWQSYITETFNANQNLGKFLKQLFSYMDRGYVFKLINHYLSFFTQQDSKVLFELRFNFIRIICSHEHYIPLNLPMPCRTKSEYSYSMDENFCQNHFLVGILLKHLSSALHSIPDVRWIAIQTFRDILAKHIFDDRYQSVEEKQRIATLYVPFLRILLDNYLLLQTDVSTNESSPKVGKKSTSAGVSKNFDNLPSIGQGSLRIKKPDAAIMNAIANPSSTMLHRGARGSLAVNTTSPSSGETIVSNSSNERLFDKATPSIASTMLTITDQSDRCDSSETRSLLLCFLQIVENLPSEALFGFWKDSTSKETMDFFDVLELCLHQFRYTGKKDMFNKLKSHLPSSLGKLIDGNKSKTLPGRVRMSMTSQSYNKNISTLAEAYVSKPSMSDEEVEKCQLLASNLSTQVGMIILDAIAEYTRCFKKQLKTRGEGDSKMMYRIINLLLMFLQVGQSETTLKHAFASLRLVLGKFPNILFRGPHNTCASFIYHTLRCCDSYLQSTRSEACALLYLLMRKNYENGHQRNFVRSHLQMIKAVSQLISEQIGIGSSRFQSSLSVINTYATSDKGMQRTSFPSDVKNLMKKIRTVLMSTAAMREHQNDPEMTVDLQYRLASSYAATPELRKTWLESMARLHNKHHNYSEAAMCYLHIAALIAEHLKKKNIISKGASAFRSVSPNIEKEETSVKEDAGLDDDTYNEDIFNDVLHECAEFFEKAERYEVLQSVFKMVMPYYEKHRNYDELAGIHERIAKGYRKVVEVNRNGKRMLGTYFRVAFFGLCFGDEDGKEYIYKEPKLTQLSEISQRLKDLYGGRFGHENLHLIQESGKVNRKTLDPELAYVQVTFVQPYFDEKEEKQKITYFERQHNIRNFCFETPFTPGGRARGNIDEQWKRKTICTTSHTFPYIKKRIAIVSMRSFELKPIEVAVDEMTTKCQELEQLVTADRVDLKKLQLRLQGSVNCQVNAGPLAYAQAFLDENKQIGLSEVSVNNLRNIFRKFVDLCSRALQINSEMILLNQQQYHDSLMKSFQFLVEELQNIMNETLIIDADDADTFSINTTGNDSVFSFSSTQRSMTSQLQVGGTVEDSSVA